MQKLFITILAGAISLCNGAIETPELSKITTADNIKRHADPKDLETSASDRTFLIGKDYGYNGAGYGSGYGYYPGSAYGTSYNKGYTPNSIYRGYQSGLNGIIGGSNSGWGYYGTGLVNGGYGGYGGLGGAGYYGNGIGYGSGYGVYDDGFQGSRGYNRWNNIDGYGSYGNGVGAYGNYIGSGYGSSIGSGYGNYPYVYRGYGSYSGSGGYPSGYRGYS